MCLGIPGRVVEITDDATMPIGVVDFGGVRRETCLAYAVSQKEQDRLHPANLTKTADLPTWTPSPSNEPKISLRLTVSPLN